MPPARSTRTTFTPLRMTTPSRASSVDDDRGAFGIFAGKRLRRFEHGDRAAEAAERLRQFEPDDPAPMTMRCCGRSPSSKMLSLVR